MKKRILTLALALIMCLSLFPATALAAYTPKYTAYADRLNVLGLFNGTGTDSNGHPIYQLDRAPTRAEALVMLIRLLGEEENAKSYTGENPFTDTESSWAKAYVAYAYSKGYTTGVSATAFNPNTTATANMYLTFLLRALGYSDKSGDFSYSTAYLKAAETGVCKSGQYTSDTFYRDDCVYTSYNALSAEIKDAGVTLAKTLADKGVISAGYAETFGLTGAADTGSDKLYLLVKATNNYGYDTYSYDSHGNLLTDTFTLNNGGGMTLTYSYIYNTDGSVQTTTYNNANETYTYAYTYNADGSVASMLETYDNASGGGTQMKHTYTYDAFGNLLTERNANVYYPSNVLLEEYTYDAFGNPLTYSYTQDGELWESTRYTYTYDAAGRVLTEKQLHTYSSSSDETNVEYTYDSAGNCVRMKYADSSMAYMIEYGYDSNGCLISQKRFLEDGVTLDFTTTYEYKEF
ncbi:S-layer homology domain-containing protein [Papillibacter cinnamivorans]|uniref:YD repeat-containing protein n=1 Tax=Papillibacter cinnamivorans DSM 12816 TaxID=1122930 RepID=A0A1W2CNB4_9FIRM|nr:S-layer homology domain-containing protein [Papillibacter cinnamivorans]SMC86735.1 YD repeat-containing protein [Papillibacter cinnamivorans DSM 12816]